MILTVYPDAFNPQIVETYEGDNVDTLLRRAFPGDCLPDNVRLYHHGVALPIASSSDVDAILAISDELTAIVEPQGLGLAPLLISLGVGIVIALASRWLMKKMKIPNMGAANSPPSPNNLLSDRQNMQRLGARLPDIYGIVWSVPDNIAPTYTIYSGGESYEFSFYCIGRGVFSANTTDVLDDTVRLKDISGAYLEYHHPDNVMGMTDTAGVNTAPSMTVGNPLAGIPASFAKFAVKKFDVDTLLPAPDNNIKSDDFRVLPNYGITATDFDFKGNFSVGQKVKVQEADKVLGDSGTTYNINGDYTVKSVDDTHVYLQPVNSTIAEWEKLTKSNDVASGSITIGTTSDSRWSEWVYTDYNGYEDIWCSIVAPNGLYQPSKDGNTFKPVDVIIVFELETLSNDGTFVGAKKGSMHLAGRGAKNSLGQVYEQTGNSFAISEDVSVVNPITDLYMHAGYTKNNDVRKTAGSTFKLSKLIPQQFCGRIRFRRYTPTLKANKIEAVQDIKVVAVYGANTIHKGDYRDDITTVYLMQKATDSALAVKNRKLKIKVERLINFDFWQTGYLSTTDVSVSIIHMLVDKYIGRMLPHLDLIDARQIIGEVKKVNTYFGYPLGFNHTFDDDNISAADMVQTACDAIFCTAKRNDGKINITFECGGAIPVAIFNAHNILPDTYNKSLILGNVKDHKGVKIEYKKPRDDSQGVMRYEDTLGSPDDVKLVGVRDYRQAYHHMMRRWGKQQYGHLSLEFVGGDESNIVTTGDVILVTDQLRTDTMQGSVTGLVGNVLSTSEPIQDLGNLVIFIQTTAGTVESIPCTYVDDYHVQLARLPVNNISATYDSVVRATYQLVADNDGAPEMWIVIEKEPTDGGNNKLVCINYDERYYAYDKQPVPLNYKDYQ